MAGRISEKLQKQQAKWLREWQRYLVMRHMGDARSALEVGCGCGYIMENLSDILHITGVDSSQGEVDCGRARGFRVIKAMAENLPFKDESFDLVYSNYLLLWIKEPRKVVREMFRASKRYVVFFAEPYWKGAIYDPPWIGDIVKGSREIIRRMGGNPDFGIYLGKILKEFASNFLIGTIPLYTSHSSMKKMVEFEIEFLRNNGYGVDEGDINIFYVPTFWALVDKSHG